MNLGGIKVAALSGGRKSPAARFRVRQYIPLLAQLGVYVQEYIPFFGEGCGLPSPFKALSHIPGVLGSRKADVTWFGRELVQGYETFERFLKRPRVLDVDDAIWLDWPFGKYAIPRIAKMMDAVVAGNSFLGEWFGKFCRKVYVLPTAIDVSRYTKRPDSIVAEKKKFTIGWTGLASNYPYLKLIEDALAHFLKDHPDSELKLVADRPLRKTSIPADRIRFVRWNEQVETDALRDMSVGVMPLPDNVWTRGKCSFKMLQYMAVGAPVVVSPVGMNLEILAKGNVGFAATKADEWYAAIDALYKDQNLQIRLGNNARKVVEEHFSAAKVAGALADIFKGLVK
ncbi:MAG: glycosyltransferase family 4 protein [Sedimentisphaerales bacterium]|nr:glycosyltransferase family 4 protein [Sedimentisphaerales bacterium]